MDDSFSNVILHTSDIPLLVKSLLHPNQSTSCVTKLTLPSKGARCKTMYCYNVVKKVRFRF